MKAILKWLDDLLLDQAYRRAKLNARRAGDLLEGSDARRRLTMVARERRVSLDDAIFATEIPRFIGGTTGRSGTRWLVRLLKHQFSADPVVMDEVGVFVLALFREAPYEFFQFGTDDAADRRDAYLQHFLRQMATYGFRRRRMYGGGMRGLVEYVPQRAIELAGEALRRDLTGVEDYEVVQRRFGQFYLHLLNYHAAVIRGGRSGWISKEPPYGRHADELLAMVPNGRLVVLARDGRASALSMYRRRWMSSVRGCMERWGVFAEMTLRSLERAPREPVLFVRYEDLVRDFEAQLTRIHRFFELPEPDFGAIYRSAEADLIPNPQSLDRWKDTVEKDDLRWFDRQYGELMERLGYTDA